MKKIIWIFAITLAGCASTGVIPIGQDTFMLSKQGAAAWSSVGAIKGELFQEGMAYCGGKSQKFQVINSREQPGGFGKFPEAEIQFMCLESGDQELRRPKLQSAPDTIVEIKK